MNDLKEKIVRNLDKLKERIHYIMNQVFDSLRFPGGTAPDGSSSSTVVCIVYDEETREFYFLVLPYNSKCKINKDKGHKKEDPKDTARREFNEETHLEINPDDLYLLDSFSVPDTIRKGMIHTKYVYYVDGTKVAGHLAEFVFSKVNPMDIGNPETGTPILIPASYLSEVLFKKHLTLVTKAIEYLLKDENGKAIEDKNYANALVSINQFVS
jgi:ADP-ribose pyrophosphatase YjhB (NUDIX family)